MPNYKLGITNKGNGRIIELEEKELKKLNKLDLFTSKFKDEEELKLKLLELGLINKSEMGKNILVYYMFKGTKHIPVIYQDMYKYIEDPMYLRATIFSLTEDLEFLEKLANHYANHGNKFDNQGINVQDIRLYISDVKNNDGKGFYSNSLNAALDDLIIKACNRIDSNTGELSENYKGFRDLAVFVYKYLNKKQKKEEKETKEDIKKENLWEQTSMFDKIDNSKKIDIEETIDDDFVEPIFPPNSEEEVKYNEYLQKIEEDSLNQPIEEHDHYHR